MGHVDIVVFVQPHLDKHREQHGVVDIPAEHNALAAQVEWMGDTGVGQCCQHQRRLLKNRCQYDDIGAPETGQYQAGVRYTVVSPAFQHCFGGGLAGNHLAELDIQPLVGEVTLFAGGIVARELELVVPFQLQGDGIPGEDHL